MTVKEIIMTAAAELGIKERARAYFEENDTDGERAVMLLLDCFHLVQNEVALDYLPQTAEDELMSSTGSLSYLLLKYPVVRVLKVLDENGESVPFQIFPDYLKTQPGKVKVQYTYTPEKKGLEDEAELGPLVSERLISYGIAAEYALASGLFEEAAAWDKKYKAAIAAAYRAHPGERIRSRRWV